MQAIGTIIASRPNRSATHSVLRRAVRSTQAGGAVQTNAVCAAVTQTSMGYVPTAHCTTRE